MKRVVVVGAFCKGIKLFDGQTVKTKIIADELIKNYGIKNIWCIDTYGKINNILSVFKCVWALFISHNIIILPAQNALKVLAPWLAIWNNIFHRRLHYVVIGGWLDIYLNQNPKVNYALHKFYCIYVETKTMLSALKRRGLTNVIVLPNCKNLKILKEEELSYSYTEPFRLVTFSRVMRQKGIEDAARVVSEINTTSKRKVFTLDIYGQIDPDQKEWFDNLNKKYDLSLKSSAIQYKGCVPFVRSVEVLSSYFALLFPTRFFTEGIPGTIIDSYAAGVPVISARWESYADVIDRETGLGFEFENWDELKILLLKISRDPNIINSKKIACINKAKNYLPSEIIPKINLI